MRSYLPGILENPSVQEEIQLAPYWTVVVYDNEFNSWGEVQMILMVATDCTEDEAYVETWEVHHLGRSVVHHGEKEECETAAEIIRTIGIQVDVVAE